MAVITKNSTISVTARFTDSEAKDLATGSFTPAINYSRDLTLVEITKGFSDSRSFTTSDALDVSTGLTGGLNNSIGFATVKKIVIHNTGTVQLTIGGGSNPLFAAIVVPVNGIIALVTSITTSGSVKNINSSCTGTGSYDLIIEGV